MMKANPKKREGMRMLTHAERAAGVPYWLGAAWQARKRATAARIRRVTAVRQSLKEAKK